jgi:hypothetical protein
MLSKPVHTLQRARCPHLVVTTGFQPPRGKIQTAPEMLVSQPAAWTPTSPSRSSPSAWAPARRGASHVRPAVAGAVGPVRWKHMHHHLAFGV